MRYFTLLGLWMLLPTFCFSQTSDGNISSEVDFAFHLFSERRFNDLIVLFEYASPEIRQNDSVNHILGMAFYYLRELELAAYHLSKVSKESAFYDKSVFFRALCYAHLSEFSDAEMILENYSTETTTNDFDELIAINLAGLALLNRDFETFDRHAQNFRFERHYYINSQNQLINVRNTLENHRMRSPFFAGVLSAVVPGAGQVYAGQLGQGIATFLTVGSFAAVTAENWYRNGLVNWKTILFGTIGTVFYIGNIFGGVAAVHFYRDLFNESQNNTILLGIHLPIRSVFR
ncbi:MAG: hypothetical protein FWD02_05530 [Bacteroidales bacterium]|nr:hypothetical protein [Bacteroidales bacterium]